MFSKSLLGIFACTLLAYPANWPTFGGDPRRTGQAPDEDLISRENVSHMKLLWSKKLDNVARELTALTAPVVLASQYTIKGVKDVVILGGSSDNVYGLDADNGEIMWSHHFKTDLKPKQAAEWLCSNALNATPVLDPGTKTVYFVSADGMLHILQAINGEELKAPMQLVTPYSKVWSLNLVDGVLYASTSQGCNGTKSGIYTLNLKDPKAAPSFFQSAPGGAGIWGRGGVAVDPDTGLAYGATGDGPFDPAKNKYGDTVLAVNAAAKLVDYFTPTNFQWITQKDLDMGNITPIIFPLGKRKLVATSGKEGIIYVLDTASLGGADHHTPLYRSPKFTNDATQFQGQGFWGAFATDLDAQGTRWLYAPAWGPPGSTLQFPVHAGDTLNGSIMAFKVAEAPGGITLTPAWISHDLAVPEPPIVSNGLLFTVASGENVMQVDTAGNLMTTAQRATTKGHAVLYVFDARTGAELFSSGDSMSDWTHFSGLALANGHLYAVTHDSTIYAFGVPPTQ